MLSAFDLTRAGIDLQLQGDNVGARLHYLAALEDDPFCLPALQNLGQIASDANEMESALVWFHRVLALRPNDAAWWSNVGNALTRMERLIEAEETLLRAVELGPEFVGAWHNLALLNIRLRNYSQALFCIEKVERLGSRGLGVQNDKAHILLALGDLKAALPLFESRWATLNHLPPWDFHIQEWTGQDLRGKSILVHAEQGFGDSIMWLRFGEHIAKRSGRLVIGVTRCLVSLVEHMGFEALAVEDMNETNMKFDFQSPMYSALRWLGIHKEDVKPNPYIHISSSEHLSTNFRVGICWASGRRNSEHDWRGRYSALRDWLDLANIPNIELISLQQGRDATDVGRVFANGIVDDKAISLASDWLATAKIIADLDLVICVDTAVAHLAGAMGKPTWMLSQFSNCWRWWDIDNGTGRPWYSSMQIFRQMKPGDWKSLLGTVYSRLRELQNSNETIVLEKKVA